MSSVLVELNEQFGLKVNEEGKVVADTLKIAEVFGKRHADVLRGIDKLECSNEFRERNFALSSYITPQGRVMPKYNVSRDGFTFVAMGFTGKNAAKFKEDYIRAFNRMEEEVVHRREQQHEIEHKLGQDKQLSLDDYNKIRFSTGRTVKTFEFCEMENVKKLIEEFMDFAVDLDTQTRITRCKSAVKGIQRLHDRLASEGVANIGDCYNLLKLIDKIKYVHHITENRSNGQIKAHKTRKIEKLEPREQDYMVLDVHGFSNNYMYEYVYSDYTDKYIRVTSNSYKAWQNHFPAHQLTVKEDLGVDWDRPVTVFLKFDAVGKMDVQNLTKSLIDQVFNRIYGVDDNCIQKVVASRNQTVDTYQDGKIYICIKN